MLASILALAAASGAPGCGRPGPAAAGALPVPVLAAVLQAEDRRDPAPLRELLEDPRPAVRARAAEGLGRVGDPDDLPRLVASLADPEAPVRAAAAFALELLGSGAASRDLERALDDPAPEVRRRAARALTRVGTAESSAPLLVRHLSGKDDALSIEILLGLWRLQDPRSFDTVVERSREADPAVRSAAAYCLMRMLAASPVGATPVPGGTAVTPEQRGRGAEALGRLAADADERTREIAARGLGGEGLPGAPQTLAGLLDDPVWRVRVNALRSLGRLAQAGAGPPQPGALAPALADGNPNVRMAALDALASFDDGGATREEVRRLFAPRGGDGAARAAERAAAARALAHWEGAAFESQARGMAADPDPALRAAAATILGTMQGEAAPAALSRLSADPSPQVASAALQALAARPGAGPAAAAAAGLDAADFAVRAAAIGLLPSGDAANLPRLQAAWEVARGDAQNDARVAALRSAASIDGEAADDLLLRIYREDPDALLRRRARAALRPRRPDLDLPAVLEQGRDLPYYEDIARGAASRPRVIFALGDARVVLELHPEDAPLTVDNFVDLVRRGFFDGLAFHRVVPNFVVQGGDPRGDGSGGPGHQIRCEINIRRYQRGSVGMALDGKDSGGSQFFIAHTPQPHLDGGYTLFGQVVEGMEWIDQVAQGDRIDRAWVEQGE